MRFTRQQINDLKFIMGVEEEMIPLLPLFKPKNQMLNPWKRQLEGIFRKLGLKRGMKVLDIPCGQGGVSVPLAKRYGVNITGCDIMPAYVRYAREYSKENGVNELCKYKVGDIREFIKNEADYDVTLWIAPPHVWGKSKETFKNLRKTVRNKGLVIIADAYLCPNVKGHGGYKDYENLRNTNRGYTAFGDEIIDVYDYKRTLWDYDYAMTRREVKVAIKRAKCKKDKNIIKNMLESLNKSEREEKKMLGIAIWVIRVNKDSLYKN